MRRVRVQKRPRKAGAPQSCESADKRLRPEVRKDIARTWWPDG